MANPRESTTPLVDAYLAPGRWLTWLASIFSPVLWRKLPGARSGWPGFRPSRSGSFATVKARSSAFHIPRKYSADHRLT